MVDFGTIVPSPLMTAHIKVCYTNEEKPDIDRKWNHREHGEELVATCAQIKDDIKQTKMT
jgi:hypothetical protein